MGIQDLLIKAWDLKKTGDRTAALKLYDEAFNTLAKEASEFAHQQTLVSPLSSRVTPELLSESKKYLMRDKVACTISNNMAVIFAEMGDVEGARKLFEQAIELTPENIEYPDPKIGLSELEK